MKRLIPTWILIPICLLLPVLRVSGSDWYVKAGSDGKGTRDAPFVDIWKALDKAVRGDVIHVTQGTYNGKGGSGHYTIKIPDLTLVGGYNDDFSERNPFKYMTILERARDYKGDWTGLPSQGGFIAGSGDHSGLIVDGFVLNGESRNSYDGNGDINMKDSYPGVGIEANSPNIKVRNCIVINPMGDGIYCAWGGEENEITNCFVLNTFYNAIATRSAQPGSVVKIKNNTVAFCWYYPSRGGGMSVFVGRQGTTVMENNVFALNQTEGDEAGYGVSNTVGNTDTVMKDNLFFLCQGGYYKYMDSDKRNLIAWKASDLKDINDDGEPYMLAEAGGNSDEDPRFSPDKSFFEKFSNFVASQPGKLNMDSMNQWRASVGLPLQAEPGSKRKNFGMAYPLSAVVPNLASKVKDRGVQTAGPFPTYASEGASGESKDYAAVEFDAFKKGAADVKSLAGKAVTLKAGMGAKATTWFLPSAPREKYDCVKILLPGETDTTMKFIYAYLLKGSAGAKNWDKLFPKRADYNKKGVTIKGTAWYAGSDSYNYPVGIIIDDVIK